MLCRLKVVGIKTLFSRALSAEYPFMFAILGFFSYSKERKDDGRVSTMIVAGFVLLSFIG